jgi:hypothetical protein
LVSNTVLKVYILIGNHLYRNRQSWAQCLCLLGAFTHSLFGFYSRWIIRRVTLLSCQANQFLVITFCSRPLNLYWSEYTCCLVLQIFICMKSSDSVPYSMLRYSYWWSGNNDQSSVLQSGCPWRTNYSLGDQCTVSSMPQVIDCEMHGYWMHNVGLSTAG